VGIGATNLIIDVEGISCGSVFDATLGSGVSVILPDESAVAACEVSGGAPGVIGQDVLEPHNIIESIDGLFLSGGSVYGLACGAGMVDWLGARDKGFRFAGMESVPTAPIVCGAILFDLNNGGDKSWGKSKTQAPYYALAQAACDGAGKESFALGNVGAGYGAVAGSVKGGLGSASFITDDGFQCGALVAVNSFGSVINPRTKALWAAAFELEGEMGGAVRPSGDGLFAESKLSPHVRANTVIGIVATNAIITQGEAKRLSVMAQDGITRACRPAHTLFDGDSVFTLATGKKAIPEEESARGLVLTELGGLLSDCLTRAIGRAVWEAESLHQSISYREAFSL
jgi:L-aminopeptidase/D-esterase-like protein